MTFSMNQTRISKTKGELAFARMYEDNIACTVDPSLVGTLVSAQAVTLVNQSGGNVDSPFIVTAANPTDDIFGFVVKGLRSDSFKAKNQLDIAISESIMIMEASGALTPMIRVGISTSNQQVVDATAGHITQIGVLLDKAVNAGDLVRVLIKTPHLNVLKVSS
jgi:hypothetical protein